MVTTLPGKEGGRNAPAWFPSAKTVSSKPPAYSYLHLATEMLQGWLEGTTHENKTSIHINRCFRFNSFAGRHSAGLGSGREPIRPTARGSVRSPAPAFRRMAQVPAAGSTGRSATARRRSSAGCRRSGRQSAAGRFWARSPAGSAATRRSAAGSARGVFADSASARGLFAGSAPTTLCSNHHHAARGRLGYDAPE
jgi:hypothetical protein